MARFTIKGNHLYTVDFNNLRTFDISQPQAMHYIDRINAGFGIETIFPYGNLLFLGAQNGMHIYDISNPDLPKKISFTPHFQSYDPVVVQGNYAYVTLRSMGWNRGNMLQIYDISNLSNPQLLKEYPMNGPRGLGIDGEYLFVCDDVLKLFKISQSVNLELISTFNIQAIDVIPAANTLYVIAQDGFYQYAYENMSLSLISKIVIPRP